jgi:membrane-associated protease RseP (regulator of RpoE activity)
LGLALAVGGYFVMTTAYSPSTVQAPQVADIKPASLPTQEISSPAVQAEPTFEAVIPREEVDDRAVPMRAREIEPGTASARVRSTASLRKTNGNSAGVSEDQAVGISEEVPPKAVDANRGMLPEPPNMNGNTLVSAKSVLSRIGVEASFSGSAWTVGSVRAGSAAANAGLKAGDVIEAVNGRPLTGTTSFDSKFAGRTLRIRRDGKTISIALKN